MASNIKIIAGNADWRTYRYHKLFVEKSHKIGSDAGLEPISLSRLLIWKSIGRPFSIYPWSTILIIFEIFCEYSCRHKDQQITIHGLLENKKDRRNLCIFSFFSYTEDMKLLEPTKKKKKLENSFYNTKSVNIFSFSPRSVCRHCGFRWHYRFFLKGTFSSKLYYQEIWLMQLLQMKATIKRNLFVAQKSANQRFYGWTNTAVGIWNDSYISSPPLTDKFLFSSPKNFVNVWNFRDENLSMKRLNFFYSKPTILYL